MWKWVKMLLSVAFLGTCAFYLIWALGDSFWWLCAHVQLAIREIFRLFIGAGLLAALFGIYILVLKIGSAFRGPRAKTS
jgi:hypothetical protein